MRSIPVKHVLEQGPVLRGMGATALAALKVRMGLMQAHTPTCPAEEISVTAAPPSQALIRSYLKHVGADPKAYRGLIPSHLFPQWSFALQSRCLAGLDYPLMKTMNAGCKVEINAPLQHGPLKLRARLESIDDNGKRAILEQRVVTGTDEHPEALVTHTYAFVPLPKKKGQPGTKKKKEKVRIPTDARELTRWKISATAGLDFAKLTGDFNPVHWIPPYARAMGFRNTILHGFATMARAVEGLNQHLFTGDVHRLSGYEVRFTRPLTLPTKVGLFHKDNEFWVGDAPSGPAYLQGTFTRKASSNHE